MPGLALNPSLLVAAFDLAAVRSVTSAVRANLLAAGGVPGPLGTVQMPHQIGATCGSNGGHTTAPAAVAGPRLVHHPEPRIEGRWVHRPEPKFGSYPSIPVPAGRSNVPAGLPKVWEMPLEVRERVQPAQRPADNPVDLTAGRLLDVFA